MLTSVLLTLWVASVSAFAPLTLTRHQGPAVCPPLVDARSTVAATIYAQPTHRRAESSFRLRASADDDNDVLANESDQVIVGAVGTACALVVFASEYVLATTGCGLPAGPAGLLGATEGLSYLSVVAIVGLATWKKLKTGSGLPPGPAGLLGSAEGLSFLAIAAGLIVLALQVTNYGYIPNAIPMEGGMCS